MQSTIKFLAGIILLFCPIISFPQDNIKKEHAVVLPMKMVGPHVYAVPVSIGPLKNIPVLLDTGASGVTISEKRLAQYLAKGGIAIKIDPAATIMADGRVVVRDEYVLENLQLGKCIFKPAYVSIAKNGDSLLGGIVLRAMSPLVMNYKNKTVVLYCPDRIHASKVP